MRGSLAVVLVAIALARAAVAQPLVDDRPAEPGAVEAAAAVVAEGTALGEANKYELALGKFLVAAEAHPSATHDCLVALAYLRIGRLTLARLWLDAAGRRGDPRPAWCAGTIAAELAAALEIRSFVAVTFTVEPDDAEVWAGDAHFRGGREVWLPPGEVEVRAERDGREPVRTTVTAASELRVELVLEEARGTTVRFDEPPPAAPRRPRWTWAPVAVGVAALATGGVFHALAYRTRDQAMGLPASSPEFDALDREFLRERAIAIGGYAIGAVAISIGVWLVRGAAE
jgi:hypothetical protein